MPVDYDDDEAAAYYEIEENRTSSLPGSPTEFSLPPHAAEVMTIFGFPYGADDPLDLWWRTRFDGSVVLYARCSDMFAWAFSDVEEITPDDIPLLRQCLDDLRRVDEPYHLSALFTARKRNIRPQQFWLDSHYFKGTFPAFRLFNALPTPD